MMDVLVSHEASNEWLSISREPKEKRGFFQRLMREVRFDQVGFQSVFRWGNISRRILEDETG